MPWSAKIVLLLAVLLVMPLVGEEPRANGSNPANRQCTLSCDGGMATGSVCGGL
jgi:hypothetical protein